MLTERPEDTLKRIKATGNRYTKWWLSLPLDEKSRLRQQAVARAQDDLAKIIHRSGAEYNNDKAVEAVLHITSQRLLELATDLECIVAYEIAHRVDEPSEN